MHIYEELQVKTIINASDTYTKIGGSRMRAQTLQAMVQAAQHFVDLGELATAVCSKIAAMTQNEAAFISTGCSACMVLASAALMTQNAPEAAKQLPDTGNCAKDEFVLFAPQTELEVLPYWRLLALCGAKLVQAAPTIEGLRAAIGPRCAGVWLFAGTQYETRTPDFAQAIAVAHAMGVPVLVDAAAQIPPVSNLWYYTKELGADCAVFSGGKFMMGPQTTGLLVGKREIVHACYAFSSPNMGIGRPYKVGKEEYAALYMAIKVLLQEDGAQRKARQTECLRLVQQAIAAQSGLTARYCEHGRLGQDAPRLLVDLPSGYTAQACANFLRDRCDPAVDIGISPAEDCKGEEQIFVNSINLNPKESAYVAECLCSYFSEASIQIT